MIFPITFSIPSEKVVTEVPVKTKLMSSLIPGKIDTYIYHNEEDYYAEYRQCLFATTTKKAGWDCMRHYEIMANGCIPYFPTIEECPVTIMVLLPKPLLLEGNRLYLKHKDKKINDLTSDDMIECTVLIEKLLEYTRNNLTTSKIASYILEKIDNTHASKILYLSGDTGPDYLRCVTLHGFKELLGVDCHDYPKIQHIYRGSYPHLYGKGISYTNLLDHSLHNDTLDETIEETIKNRVWDIIIYGSYHRGMPYYDLTISVYAADKIILLCGEDTHACNCYNWSHPVFVRELI
jgi:hypothetical protein